MKWLADENLSDEFVQWLRETHQQEVLYASESAVAATDDALLDRAVADQRIILTADLDFGALVFERRRRTAGVVLLRLHKTPLSLRLAVFSSYWTEIERYGLGNFIVVSERKLRVRPIK